MIKIIKILLLVLTTLWMGVYGQAAIAMIKIVSAENVYGSVIKQLGGPYVEVVSILNNPNQDPHLFSISPSTAKIAMNADIIVYNGANYDPWMKSLLAISHSKQSVVVAKLINFESGSNPHIWYMPETVHIFAQNITGLLIKYDPAHHDYFKQQLARFNDEYQAIFNMIKTLKSKYQNTPVIATEPLFNYMADSIGLSMHGLKFQTSIMNDTPPTISEIKQFETDLRQHAVRALIFNRQVANPLTKRMLDIAQSEKIPIVGVTEMLPTNATYIKWMMQQLTELEAALANSQEHQK